MLCALQLAGLKPLDFWLFPPERKLRPPYKAIAKALRDATMRNGRR